MTTEERVGGFLRAVANGPPTQIDPTISRRLLEAASAPTVAGLRGILDDCVAFSLCSDFVVASLDAALSELRKTVN